MITNKNEYLQALREKLGVISIEEQNDALAYYNEYFDEAGEQNYQNVINKLGEPARVAAQIIAEAKINKLSIEKKSYSNSQNTTNKHISNIWYIILGIFAVPVALPIVIAVVFGLFSLIIASFAIVVSFTAVTAVLGFLSIIYFIVGVIMIISEPFTGLFFIGVSLILAGLFLIFASLVTALYNFMFKGLTKFASSLFNRLKRGHRNESNGI